MSEAAVPPKANRKKMVALAIGIFVSFLVIWLLATPTPFRLGAPTHLEWDWTSWTVGRGSYIEASSRGDTTWNYWDFGPLQVSQR